MIDRLASARSTLVQVRAFGQDESLRTMILIGRMSVESETY